MGQEEFKTLLKGLLRIEKLILIDMSNRYEGAERIGKQVCDEVDELVERMFKEWENERERSDRGIKEPKSE